MNVISIPMAIPTPQPLPRVEDDAPAVALMDLRCLECDGALNWHQPDPGRPARLLATCSGCGGWYLLSESAAGGSVLAPVPRTFEREAEAGPPGRR